MKKLTLGAIALAASTMIGSAASYAAVLTGEVFENAGAATNPVVTPPAGTPVVTFTTTNINYASPPHDSTIGGFLNDPGTTITSGNSHLNDSLTNTYFRITGLAAVGSTPGLTAASGTTASIVHDDGIQVTRNGSIVINDTTAAPSHDSTASWIGANNLVLSYGECCGSPAVLHANFVAAVPTPEPASLALLGSALVGFGVMRRRRKTS